MLIFVVDSKTWSEALREAVSKEEVKVIPYDLTLNYDYWTYCMAPPVPFLNPDSDMFPDDIMTSLLPDDAQGEIPVGFAIVGHIGILASPPHSQSHN